MIWGRLAGEAVPEVSIGPLRVTHGVDQRFAHLASQGHVTGLRATYQGAPASVRSSAEDIEVQSDVYFWVEVVADDHTPAEEVALRDHVLPLVASLVALTGYPHYAQALWSTELVTGGQIGQSIEVPLATTTAYAFGDGESPPDVSSVETVVRAMQGDRHARTAAQSLVDGLRMSFRGSTYRDKAAALLLVQQCIETLARTTHRKRLDEAAQDRQAAVVDKLRDTLGTVGSTSQAAKAIKNANIALEREHLRFLKDQICALAEELGVSEQHVDDALAVVDFRNRNLGHPSESAAGRDLQPWAEKARTSSAAFLGAYCRREA